MKPAAGILPAPFGLIEQRPELLRFASFIILLYPIYRNIKLKLD